MIQLHVVHTKVHPYSPLCGPVGYIEFSQKSFKETDFYVKKKEKYILEKFENIYFTNVQKKVVY